ncbi:hypothetical protein BpHYR1_001347 [Brachionus plicatilis]|uniref:Uncharacterized protein n=1 Tax=Brachionus plicatilis TaxID=10195 RepID=A0A3M7RII8_BRAPC|nr:hypothetical protein BpHYR1_001347 [Brachionus plicatilis]
MKGLNNSKSLLGFLISFNFEISSVCPALMERKLIGMYISFIKYLMTKKNYDIISVFYKSVLSTRDSINLLLPCETQLDFKIELQPCLVEAWNRKTVGYENIPGISDRCFLAKAVPTGVDKLAADYECQINGAYLIIFENEQKLNDVVE